MDDPLSRELRDPQAVCDSTADSPPGALPGALLPTEPKARLSQNASTNDRIHADGHHRADTEPDAEPERWSRFDTNAAAGESGSADQRSTDHPRPERHSTMSPLEDGCRFQIGPPRPEPSRFDYLRRMSGGHRTVEGGKPSPYQPSSRRASSSSETRGPRFACACSKRPPFDRYAAVVPPIARNVWQHVKGGSPAAAARRSDRRSSARHRQPPARRGRRPGRAPPSAPRALAAST